MVSKEMLAHLTEQALIIANLEILLVDLTAPKVI